MLFVVLIVCCIIATGCGNKKDNTEQANDIQTTTDEKEEISKENDENESSTAEEEIEESTSTENIDEEGYYNWQVGNYTLRTRINIYDYIDKDAGKWNANDMALAIGWGDWSDRLNDINNEGFGGNDLLLKFAHSNGACNGVNVFGTDSGTIGIICNMSTDSYTMNNTSFSVSFEYIAISAYAMENFSSPSVDPFVEIAPAVGGYYRFDQ